MIYYIVPNTITPIYSHINILFNESVPTERVSQSLSRLLYDVKEQICTREKEWDIYKKYTNTYEYIHTIIHHKKQSVSKYKPLSRSYFKMTELVNELQLFPICGISPKPPNVFSKSLDRIVKPTAIRTFHLAEGPGGFIESVVNLRKNPEDVYYGMTILDETNDYNIPAWKKSEYFLISNPNVIIEKGATGTGNILSVENFVYCYKTYASQMDFITADGGFDFSTDFNKQELHISRLLFAQVVFALVMQKEGGNFVLKIFDCFHANTVDLIFLLSSFYKTVYITKPQTSRTGNSEKYIVCKGFMYSSTDPFYSFLYNAFADMEKNSTQYIHRFLQIPIPLAFITKIEEYNAIFGQQQIENIYTTLSLIDKNSKPERIDSMVKTNISKCIQWCIRFNIPYHHSINNNTFV